jgi:hypothetical protein
VKLYDYTENDKEIVLLMQYVNDANYFEEKIEEVSLVIPKPTYNLNSIEVLIHVLSADALS